MPDTGSGYGGKHTGEAAVEAARLAREAGRPVKLVWTREEEFTWAYFRPAGVIDIKAGVTQGRHAHRLGVPQLQLGRVGHPHALRGAQPGQSPSTTSNSPLRQGSYRALASTANHFARESHMDELAHAVGHRPAGVPAEEPQGRAAARRARGRGRSRSAGAARPAPIAASASRSGSEKGGYVATCAEVAVDRSTGRVQVVRAVSAFECGAVVNPDHLKNQVEGAMIMGLGGALFEAIAFEDGKILNPKFSKYRVPRFRDAPEIEVVLLDRKDLPSAGAGETPIVAIAPAVGNAIFDATGVRLRSMPMVPQGLKL